MEETSIDRVELLMILLFVLIYGLVENVEEKYRLLVYDVN